MYIGYLDAIFFIQIHVWDLDALAPTNRVCEVDIWYFGEPGNGDIVRPGFA